MHFGPKIKQSLRELKHQCITKVNRQLGREFITNPRECLGIETCSICNLDCRFCAYGKKESVKVEMEDSFFIDLIDQAVEIGYDKFMLTPSTGDVFAGKTFGNKLEILENHPKVRSYYFHTNFTLVQESQISKLLNYKKLSGLNISLYGHDLKSFIDLTKSTDKVFERLNANLNFLFNIIQSKNHHTPITIFLRTIRTFDFSRMDDGKFSKIFRKALENDNINLLLTTDYNNWGGSITKDDVSDLDIVLNEKPFPKTGACNLIFSTLLVFADGRVNACACRDVDGELVIGDLKNQKLKDILSIRNSVYKNLIVEQQHNNFHAVCRSCDYYRSIYRGNTLKSLEKPILSLKEAFQALS